MIVVEGPDLVGKTTLAHKLVAGMNKRGLPHVYGHLSKLPDCFDHVRDYRRLMNLFTVWDRFYMSRAAYSVLDNQTPLSAEEYALLDAQAHLVPTVHVLLLPSDDALTYQWRAHSARGEMYDLDQVMRVTARYRHLAKNGITTNAWYDGQAETYLPRVDFLHRVQRVGGEVTFADDAFVQAVCELEQARYALMIKNSNTRRYCDTTND